jgi:hypothetical protein
MKKKLNNFESKILFLLNEMVILGLSITGVPFHEFAMKKWRRFEFGNTFIINGPVQKKFVAGAQKSD